MASNKGNPVFGAAVLKLTLLRKVGTQAPALRELYESTLKDLGVSNAEVDVYIDDHRPELEAAMTQQGGSKNNQNT